MQRPLPEGIEYLIEQFDVFAGKRHGSRRLPVVLLRRDAGASGPVDPAEPSDVRSTARSIIMGYQDRLFERDLDRTVDLVPHALIEDDDFAPRAPEPGEDPTLPVEQHVALLDGIVDQLENSMPHDAGELRLPRFHTCRAVLDISVGAGSAAGKRRRLRDELYLQLIGRRPLFGTLARLAGATGTNVLANIWLSLFQLLVVGLPRRLYGLWLSRRRTLRWVGSRRPKGANFLRMAPAMTRSGTARSNHALIQRMLLMALLNDLSRAARPSRLWVYRARRQWPFVLLLPAVGDEGTPVRQFLDTYADIARTERPAPLMVLGALAGEPPSYAQTVVADPRSVTGLADRVHALYTRSSASCVHLVPLSANDDDGPADRWVGTNPKVSVRANGRSDYARAVGLPLAVFTLLSGTTLYAVKHTDRPPSCHHVSTGEIVGVTDGRECHLGVVGRDDELLALERTAAKQNDMAVNSKRPYRTVVFFAPLSAEPGDSTPVSIQSLRGALAAQSQVNGREGDIVQMRLLIANSGKYFAYGSRNSSGPDIAREIIDRKDRDKIAAVIGITQSRPSSFAAVQELSAASIPVIGNSVTGSRMIDDKSPSSYFQVSPPNDRIAEIMADFSMHSEQIGELTSKVDDRRTAVVVYDPDDEFFSADLEAKFALRYKRGKVVTVPYYENRIGQIVSDVARNVCTEVRRTGGFIVYAGRSGEMPELFDALQGTADCRKADGKQVAILSESTAAKYLQDPADMLKRHSVLKPYYVMFNNSNGKEAPNSPYSEFTSRFREVFPDGSVPEGNAAGAYDSLRVASEVINSVYAQYKTVENTDARFQPTDVYARLSNPGIQNFSGASGLLSLDNQNKFPPNKAVYVLESHLDKSVTTWMACGLLPDQPPGLNNPEFWGSAGESHRCPRAPGG
ncbi:ABC transporter substrate-binding protein [Streptomyces sp. NBC_00829]|uniref:ABC transporter substrate-binding protein n=1 Tax=Streptomyces sp. NBC_00829 TaxID=2903679 RepID=UPI00386A408C|nr:ABC transporter substrate-binding protein [Streptomyces sp. NBC_00829]